MLYVHSVCFCSFLYVPVRFFITVLVGTRFIIRIRAHRVSQLYFPNKFLSITLTNFERNRICLIEFIFVWKTKSYVMVVFSQTYVVTEHTRNLLSRHWILFQTSSFYFSQLRKISHKTWSLNLWYQKSSILIQK